MLPTSSNAPPVVLGDRSHIGAPREAKRDPGPSPLVLERLPQWVRYAGGDPSVGEVRWSGCYGGRGTLKGILQWVRCAGDFGGK